MLRVLRSVAQVEQSIPESSPIQRLQPTPALNAAEASGYWRAYVFQGVLCMAHLQKHCFFFCGLHFYRITSTHTALAALALRSGRKKHLEIEMDWFVALYTGIRNMTGFSKTVKYLWACLLTVCHYYKKRVSCCYMTWYRKAEIFLLKDMFTQMF